MEMLIFFKKKLTFKEVHAPLQNYNLKSTEDRVKNDYNDTKQFENLIKSLVEKSKEVMILFSK